MVESIAITVKIIAVVVYLIIFLLTIRSKVELLLKILFILYIFGLLIWQFSSLMVHFSASKDLALFWYKFLASGIALQSILFLPFSQAFLKIKKQKIITYISYISAITISFIPFIFNIYQNVYIGKGGYYIPVFTGLFYLSGIIGYLFWGFGLFNFIKHYFSEKSNLQKNRIKYVLFGALIVVIGSLSNFTILQDYPVDIVCNLINAILIAYAVKKYHLLELRIVLKKSLLVFLVIISITLLFIIDNYLFSLIPKITKEQAAAFSGIISAILILVFILIIQVEKLNRFFQYILYPESKNYQDVFEDYSKNINSIVDVEKLKRYFFDTVKNVIKTDLLILVIYNSIKRQYVIELAENNNLKLCNLEDLSKYDPLIDLLKKKQNPILKEELFLNPIYSKVVSDMNNFLKEPCAEVLVPIIVTDKLYGFLIMGKKKKNKPYTVQDLRFLATLSNTTATGIANSSSYHELQSRFAEQMLLFLLSDNFSKTDRLEVLIKRSCDIFMNFLEVDWVTISLFLPGFKNRVITSGNLTKDEENFVKSINQDRDINLLSGNVGKIKNDFYKNNNSLKIDFEKNVYESEKFLLFIPLIHNNEPIGSILLKFRDIDERSRFIEEKHNLLRGIQTVVSQGIALHYTVMELQTIKNRNEMILEGVGKAGNIIFITDINGKIKRVNSASKKLLGYKNEEIIGNDILNYFKLSDKVLFEKFMENYRLNRGIEFHDISLLKKDGSTLPIILSVVEVQENTTNKDGSYLFIAKDISAIKIAEENVKRSEEKYRRLFSEIDEIIIILNPQGIITDINPAGVKLLRYPSQKDLIGKDIRDVIELEKTQLDKIYYEVLKNGQVKNKEFMVKRNGREIYLITNINMVRNSNGEVLEIRVVIHDITELKLLEKQLIQAQKMESVGTLAGGIAHDFNNILTAILGYASVMKNKIEKNNPFYEYLSVIESSANRAAGLIGKLLAFARAGKYQEKLIDINKLIKETVALLKETIERNIEIIVNLTEDIPRVKGDENQIHQVIMNLCVNARDAMPEGGKLKIKTGVKELDEKYVKEHMGAKKGRYVFISIEDTGYGIEEENLKRIFDPFFTTKEKGKGTGLGLSVVYGVVKNHNGYIDVKSKVGHGTVFEVFFPPCNELTEEKKDIPEKIAQGTGETILVIDDEENVRQLIKDILEVNGYKVLLANNGIEGIEIYNRYSDKIDLVLLDMVMPKLGGEDTFIELKKLNPKVKVILSTGYSNDEKLRNIIGSGIKALVTKPFKASELLSTIKKAI